MQLMVSYGHNAFGILAVYMLLFFLSSPSGSSDVIQACNCCGVKLCFLWVQCMFAAMVKEVCALYLLQ